MDQGGINPISRELARQLLGYESVARGTWVDGPVAFQVCDKLRQPLATLMERAAFQSLLGRALLHDQMLDWQWIGIVGEQADR